MDQLLRIAIWEAHGKQCAYSGEPVRFADLEIDHIIPRHVKSRPGTLIALLQRYGLPREFDLDGIENLLPTSRKANRSKGAAVGDLRTAHALELARSRAERVKAIRNRLAAEDAAALARVMLTLAWDSGQIDQVRMRRLFEQVQQPQSIELSSPLYLADEVVEAVARQNVLNLLDRRLVPRPCGLEKLTVCKGDVTHDVFTCRQWLDAFRNGYAPCTNYDVKESAFFLAVATVVWGVTNRRPFDRSFTRRGLADLDLLPVTLWPHLSSDERDVVEREHEQGISLQARLTADRSRFEVRPGYVNFDAAGLEAMLWEVLRGDFSGEGFEQILVKVHVRSLQGTYNVTSCYVLSRKDDQHLFEAREIAMADLYELLDLTA